MKSGLIFVCTSNTCRSPMAMGFALSMFPNDLEFVWSRSISTDYEPENSPANKNALAVMKNTYNIDISDHRSKLLSSSDINKASHLICVSKRHAAFIQQNFPNESKNKLVCFDSDIADPWNQEAPVYEKCALELKSAVHKVVESLL